MEKLETDLRREKVAHEAALSGLRDKILALAEVQGAHDTLAARVQELTATHSADVQSEMRSFAYWALLRAAQ